MKNKWHIETRLIAELIPHPKNPRQFTEKGMKDLGRSIDAFGLAEPVVVNTDNTIIGGHARVKVLQMKGETKCECYVPDRQLSEKEVEQLMIRLNANQAGVWDTERLANEWDLSELMDWGLDISGFGQPEATEDDYEMPDEIITSIKRGDLFQIGEHYLLCGDCTKSEDVSKLMCGEKADLLFTDPPYGINLDTDFSKMRSHKDFFLQKSGKYKKVEGDEINYNPEHIFRDFGYCKEIFLWGGDYYLGEMLKNGSLFCWDKRAVEGTNFKQSSADSRFGSMFELCWSKKKHKREMIRILWSGFMGLSADSKKRIHPTQKPIGLCKWFIEKFSKRGQNIIDLFGGSGSTLIACEQLNRNCYMMEIDERYCQVIIDRMKKSFPDIEIKRNGITCDMNDLKQKDISLPV